MRGAAAGAAGAETLPPVPPPAPKETLLLDVLLVKPLLESWVRAVVV